MVGLLAGLAVGSHALEFAVGAAPKVRPLSSRGIVVHGPGLAVSEAFIRQARLLSNNHDRAA